MRNTAELSLYPLAENYVLHHQGIYLGKESPFLKKLNRL